MNNTIEQTNSTVSNNNHSTSQIRYAAPVVNIYENKEGYLLEAELPGVSKEGVEITLEGSELTFVGRKSHSDLAGASLYRETQKVDYRRSFELDPSINTQAISGKMENGVLRITLPKAEKLKPRKIEITS